MGGLRNDMGAYGGPHEIVPFPSRRRGGKAKAKAKVKAKEKVKVKVKVKARGKEKGKEKEKPKARARVKVREREREEITHHSADQNLDYLISLSELLRVIQFYNSGGYHCDASGEDGYAPAPGDTRLPRTQQRLRAAGYGKSACPSCCVLSSSTTPPATAAAPRAKTASAPA